MSQYADWLSQFRVFPRLFSIFYLYGAYEIADWFMGIEDPSAPQSAFASAVIAAAAAWFKFYVEGGAHGRTPTVSERYVVSGPAPRHADHWGHDR